MQSLRKLLVALVAVASLVSASIGPVFADPIGGRNAVHFSLTCGGQEFEVVSANEPAASVHIVGNTSMLIATEAVLITTFTDPQTGETVSQTQTIVYGAGHGQAQGLQGNLTTCTHTTTIEDPDVGPITVTLTGTFLMTPHN